MELQISSAETEVVKDKPQANSGPLIQAPTTGHAGGEQGKEGKPDRPGGSLQKHQLQQTGTNQTQQQNQNPNSKSTAQLRAPGGTKPTTTNTKTGGRTNITLRREPLKFTFKTPSDR